MVWKRNSESDMEEADAAEIGLLDMTGVVSAEDRSDMLRGRMICRQLKRGQVHCLIMSSGYRQPPMRTWSWRADRRANLGRSTEN